MTVTEIVEEVSYRTGSELDIANGFIQTFLEVLGDHIESGAEVKVRGIGTFKWQPSRRELTGVTAGLGSGPGYKLKFLPAGRFIKRRRLRMGDEEGMDKLGVELDNDKTKTAGVGSVNTCPVCGSELDGAGACPTHGTEPFESR